MKVITRERLIELLKHCNRNDADLINFLIRECKEIDTLTVTNLRPMCGAPKDGIFLAKMISYNALHEANIDTLGNVWIGELYFDIEMCEGWIPMPNYKPEFAGNGNSEPST